MKSLIKWQNQKLRHIKQMDDNCHIPDLVQAFSYEENAGLNLVLELAKPLTCMTVAQNSITLTTMIYIKIRTFCRCPNASIYFFKGNFKRDFFKK